MTTRPELADDINLLPGLAAIALFVVLAVPILTAEYGVAQGFSQSADITASIGYALFNFAGDASTVQSEGFLAPFEIIAVVLVAALVAAVMLARREGRNVVEQLRGGEP